MASTNFLQYYRTILEEDNIDESTARHVFEKLNNKEFPAYDLLNSRIYRLVRKFCKSGHFSHLFYPLYNRWKIIILAAEKDATSRTNSDDCKVFNSREIQLSTNFQNPLNIDSSATASRKKDENVSESNVELKEEMFMCVKSYEVTSVQLKKIKMLYDIVEGNNYSILVDSEKLTPFNISKCSTEEIRVIESSTKGSPPVDIKTQQNHRNNLKNVTVNLPASILKRAPERQTKRPCIDSSVKPRSKKMKLSVSSVQSSSHPIYPLKEWNKMDQKDVKVSSKQAEEAPVMSKKKKIISLLEYRKRLTTPAKSSV